MIVLVFFGIAFLFASAGFGGGSMYLAVLSQITDLSFFPMKFHGLVNNLGVTMQGTWQWRKSLTDRKKEIMGLLLAAALPCMAFGLLEFQLSIHKMLLGLFLTIGGLAILGQRIWEKKYVHLSSKALNAISFFIGSIAGLTGIGGGIYFSPILHLCRWGKPKEIAAFTAIFIAVNSALSLIILSFRSDIHWNILHWDWLLAVIIGGFLGSKIAITWLKQEHVKWITGILLIFAGQQLIWQG